MAQAVRGSSRGGTNWLGILGTIAGIAVSLAVPFIAPAVASSIFGASIMASLGGFGGILATAGTGAVLGGIGAAITGGDWKTGAIFGGLGAGAVQGFGGLASGAGSLFGGGAAAGLNTAGAAAPGAVASATGAGLAAPTLTASGSAFAGGAGSAAGLGAAATGAAPVAALGAFQMPWDKLFNAALGQGATALGAGLGEYLPPSEEALARQAALDKSLQTQEETYKLAMKGAADIDPHYFAQTAANGARLRAAGAMQEGERATAGLSGVNDPSRQMAENRRSIVAASGAAGQAYNDSYLTALQAKQGQQMTAAGLKPDYGAYARDVAAYGVDAEKDDRAEEWGGWLAPFFGAFAKTNTSQQAGTG